jgi:hypothetical protein
MMRRHRSTARADHRVDNEKGYYQQDHDTNANDGVSLQPLLPNLALPDTTSFRLLCLKLGSAQIAPLISPGH